jgi:hypothetical protein
MDKLSKCSPSRIVNLTSSMYKRGQIDFEDLNMTKKQANPKIAYEQAELAIVLSTQEFCRQFPGLFNRKIVLKKEFSFFYYY